MWLPNTIISEVDRVARIHYINSAMCQAWNARRDPGELRLLTGWCWSSRNGGASRQGFKTLTVAYRDAWYALVANREAPYRRNRVNLRVVA